jgi:hypothetical protein
MFFPVYSTMMLGLESGNVIGLRSSSSHSVAVTH